jgi:hypothetical protein
MCNNQQLELNVVQINNQDKREIGKKKRKRKRREEKMEKKIAESFYISHPFSFW